MKLPEMLELYRLAAPANMKQIATEFRSMSPPDQAELLFWMVVDASTNPMNVRTENVGQRTAS